VERRVVHTDGVRSTRRFSGEAPIAESSSREGLMSRLEEYLDMPRGCVRIVVDVGVRDPSMRSTLYLSVLSFPSSFLCFCVCRVTCSECRVSHTVHYGAQRVQCSYCTLRVTKSTVPRGTFGQLSVGRHGCPVTATELSRREPHVLPHVAAVHCFRITWYYSYVLLLEFVCSPVCICMPHAYIRRQRRPPWNITWLFGQLLSRRTSHRATDMVASHSWRSFS